MLSSTFMNLINVAYEYSYEYSSTSGSGGGLGVFTLVPLGVTILMLVSMWKMFTKAGQPGWASIVPIYNTIILIKMANLSMIYLLFLCIPFLNIYAIFKIYIEIAHKFGKSSGYGVGMIFLSVIFIPMLAFGDATYDGITPYSETNNNNNYNNGNNNYNNTNTNNQPMNFDPQTGKPLTVTGYNPETGAPIYGNAEPTNTFVSNNAMNQPQTNTFVSNETMSQPQTNTFVSNDTMNQPQTNTFVSSEPTNINNQVVEQSVNNVTEPVNNTQVTPNIDRPDATPINDINNQ